MAKRHTVRMAVDVEVPLMKNPGQEEKKAACTTSQTMQKVVTPKDISGAWLSKAVAEIRPNMPTEGQADNNSRQLATQMEKEVSEQSLTSSSRKERLALQTAIGADPHKVRGTPLAKLRPIFHDKQTRQFANHKPYAPHETRLRLIREQEAKTIARAADKAAEKAVKLAEQVAKAAAQAATPTPAMRQVIENRQLGAEMALKAAGATIARAYKLTTDDQPRIDKFIRQQAMLGFARTEAAIAAEYTSTTESSPQTSTSSSSQSRRKQQNKRKSGAKMVVSPTISRQSAATLPMQGDDMKPAAARKAQGRRKSQSSSKSQRRVQQKSNDGKLDTISVSVATVNAGNEELPLSRPPSRRDTPLPDIDIQVADDADTPFGRTIII